MIKKLFIIIVLFSAYLLWALKTRPIMITPYPYYFKTKLPPQKILPYEKSDVLILGDDFAKHLTKYLPSLISKVSQNLSTPMNILSWARENDGLHRSLFKLKALKKMPPIIIYHGGNKEFYEEKFSLKDFKKIKKNFDLKQNDKLHSLILTFPQLSKFFYSHIPLHYLNPLMPQKNEKTYTGKQQQYRMDLSYRIYQHELKDLLVITRAQNAKLILITSPLNLLLPPREVCSNTQNAATKRWEQKYFEKKQDTSFDLKKNFKDLEELKNLSLGNAMSFHLFGRAALALGKIPEGKKALQMATAYDCHLENATYIHNQLLRQFSRHNKIQLIDFDQLVNHQLERKNPFGKNHFPQDSFYQKLIEELSHAIKKHYQLSTR